ncbi:POU domain, class 6, transcription factor 1 isoform X5 [Chiloscyllium plagiosum]|uniref:POU domain, class 6, transcription factor 1 isoform X5 n=1 Tax=Chiloscyllium plagiosum TaxID=36176 RepID=UPI001CB8666C|nr:POU domain, class 6, transcription factor 1 isoform X5 [Chiloscyllium plagiosum]
METGSLTEQCDALSIVKQATVMTGQEIIKVSLRKAEVSSKAAGDVEPRGIVLPAAVVGEENNEHNVSTEASRVPRTSMEKNHHCGSTEHVETTPPSDPTPVTEGQAEQLHLQPQQALPISAPTVSQILPSENLATVVMASTGSVPLNQPLLIPLNMAGQVTAQQGLVLTIPTASLASLPSLTSATGAGGILKLPLANLQAASMLNPALQPTQLQQVLQPQATLQSLPTSAVPLKQLEPQTQVTSVHQAQGLTLNPTIVIGTVPLVMNPATITTTDPVTAVAAQSLQVQAVTPQMLLNSQGQVIATVISNQFVPVLSRQGVPLSPVKTTQQVQTLQTMASVTQPSVTPTTATAPTEPITPSSTSSAASVGQLVSKPQNAPTEVDGINLEEIREFAKNFKIRRLSLGLTQTQVGQALSAAEGPAYSQSAICRFEKLDITPKSAQKIKPVLERWLTEAEIRHRAGIQNLTEFVGSEPSKKRKRRTSFTPQALEILNAHFEKNTHPTGQEMTEIAEQLNYDREVVRVWFCNKRQTLKNTIKRLQQNDTAGRGSVEQLSDSAVNAAGTG